MLLYRWFCQLVSLAILGGAYCEADTSASSNDLSIRLDSQWQPASFALNLLESIADLDDDLYVPTLLQLLGISNEDEDNEELPIDSQSSDQEKYTYIMNSKSLKLSQTSKAFAGFNFVNKINYPKVQAHHDYYFNVVEPELGERLAKECSTDSFGNPVRSHKHFPSSFVLYNDKFYCSLDDLYALQTDKVTEINLEAFDRVFGHKHKAPTLILYGNIDSPDFSEIFNNLYQSAQSGKINFVWRYLPLSRDKTKQADTLSGYGVDLTLKRDDYVVIDDRDINAKKKSKNFKTSGKRLKLQKDLWKILQIPEIEAFSQAGIEDFGAKLTSFVLYNSYKNVTSYELLNILLSDFPRFASYIDELTNLRHISDIKNQATENEGKGLSKESYGLYVNGSPLHKLNLDLINLLEKIEDELRIIRELKALGFRSSQAKFLIKKFALLSAVKNDQYRSGNTLMGNNENRFKVYENVFTSGSFKRKRGVVFLNNIEKDTNYGEFPVDRNEAYLVTGKNLQPNQIPPLRENVHDVIFAINLSNKGQLKVLFTLAKAILDHGIPQQIGIIAMDGGNGRDRALAERFYFISDTTSSQEALAFLYKYLESESEETVEDMLKLVDIPEDYDFDHGIYQRTLNKFSIEVPSIIFNGVIYQMQGSNWQLAMSRQIVQDVALLKNHISQGTDKGKPLKQLLYDGAKSTRNLKITPIDPSDVLYKNIDNEVIEASTAFKRHHDGEVDTVSGTFWLIGDFNKSNLIEQLKTLLLTMKKSKRVLQIRILNTGFPVEELEKIASSIDLNQLSVSDIDQIIDRLNLGYHENSESTPNLRVIKLLESKSLPVLHDFLLFNSRYFRLDTTLDEKEVSLLVDYEFNQRFSILDDIVTAYPDMYDRKRIVDFNSGKEYDALDWADLVSGIVTKSFYSEKFYYSDVARFDFTLINTEYSLNIGTESSNPEDDKLDKDLDILVIIDPTDEESQKLVAIVNSIVDLPFLSVKILIHPRNTEEDKDQGVSIRRFYRGVYPRSVPEFDSKGRWISEHKASFSALPSSEILTVDLDSPSKWITVTKDSPLGVDLDNIKFENLENKSVLGVYELKSILIEGFARDVKIAKPPIGAAFEITNADKKSDTSVMSSLGYFQLQAGPGVWNLAMKDGDGSITYELLSASDNKFMPNAAPLDIVKVSVFNLKGRTLYPRLQKSESESSVIRSKATKHADINIFTIASGHLYERFLSIMIASVNKHTSKSVKFWILENFISSHFKQLVPYLAEKYGFGYEFVTYKWPDFLRGQREKQRTIWGYKILFLDVLFPQDLERVIFVDADQIVRTDLHELVQMDLQGAPYGFTPMCDSREEMEGFRFWKQGYWSQVLENDLKYHISALFVVDLKKFRSMKAGDELRSHYQKLSSDPNSLSNLDQDLPNNLQRKVPIFSLPQDWLWCETWCSDSTMKNAKTIDLCNNPLTKENKLDRARRSIPEWEGYDEEVYALVQEVNKKIKSSKQDRNSAEPEDDTADSGIQDESDDDIFEHDEL